MNNNILKGSGAFIVGAILAGSITFSAMPGQAQETITVPDNVDPATLEQDIPVVVNSPTIVTATTTIATINARIVSDQKLIGLLQTHLQQLQSDITNQQALLDSVTPVIQASEKGGGIQVTP